MFRPLFALLTLLTFPACTSREFVDIDDDADDPITQGAQGDRGEVGPRGPRGPQGPAWRPVTYVPEPVSVELEPGMYDEAVVECEPGDIVLQGGCQFGDWVGDREGIVRPYLSIGTDQANTKDAFGAWLCSGTSEETERTTRIYASAVCLVVSP